MWRKFLIHNAQMQQTHFTQRPHSRQGQRGRNFPPGKIDNVSQGHDATSSRDKRGGIKRGSAMKPHKISLDRNTSAHTQSQPMSTINRDLFIAQFKEEVDAHLTRITQRLFQLEEPVSDHDQLLEEIFRTAHTLKGSSRMMGYLDISTLAHKMEDLLVEIRDGHLDLTPMISDLLFYTLDTINYLVEGISKNIKRSADLEAFTRLFTDAIAGKPIEVPFVQPHLLQAEPTLPTPPIPASTPEGEHLDDSEEQQYVRIHPKALDTILHLIEEILANQKRHATQLTTYQDVAQTVSEHLLLLTEFSALLHHKNGSSPPALVSQLVAALKESASAISHQIETLQETAETQEQRMQLAMTKLQEQVMGIRMVPASHLFQLFPRLVRVTARKLGKMVELHLLGEDVTLDSRILEEMRDPLIHLVQNAIKHGIEIPEKRRRYGKSLTGHLTLSAVHADGHIVIRIQDDGRGIHPEQIKAMALKQGLRSRSELATLQDQSLFDLLFLPGFSTSDAVDDIAGRGFGLDIVKTHVNRVHGTIAVHSQPGEGTEFVITLPCSLTTLNALLVRTGEQSWAIPTTAVVKTAKISPTMVEYRGNTPGIAYENSWLPLAVFEQLVDASPAQNSDQKLRLPPQFHETPEHPVVVIQAEDCRIACIIDDLLEEREIVITQADSAPHGKKNRPRTTTVHGQNVNIVNVTDLAQTFSASLETDSSAEDRIRPTHPTPKPRLPLRNLVPKILLIDDSLNIREVERNILEKAGYDVEIAENGQEGLDKLKATGFDLVVTDIEMPHMDGWKLIEMIRDDATLHELPVVVVSTDTTDAARKKGLAVGVKAYLTKEEFDERLLLRTVDDCLK
ncbi:response regulator [candidate division KSB3 bacterium]|uniref:histidine kinase n=1 Tax=candidate division KSB3 bacterium TaxID=2044937 RepID=A0A9D5JZZ9_9BACT|nr:response regulator [candidate division KSB3 bacterium]MBD3327422.1 response regulator [candidate division KSB3 bacterium]